MTFGNPYKGYHKSIHLEFILPTIYARVLNIWDIRGCILRNNKNKVIASVCTHSSNHITLEIFD